MAANLQELRGQRMATKSPPTIFDFLEHAEVKKGIAAVAGKYLTADRMLRLCVNAVKKTPRLAECDPKSVLGAMMTSAALGLEPNTVQQQAFLIPYKKRVKVGDNWIDTYDCQFQIGYRGLSPLPTARRTSARSNPRRSTRTTFSSTRWAQHRS